MSPDRSASCTRSQRPGRVPVPRGGRRVLRGPGTGPARRRRRRHLARRPAVCDGPGDRRGRSREKAVMRPGRGLADTNGLEVLVPAGSYGLTPADSPAQLTGQAGSQAAGAAWPVRSGLVPPLADGFIARPETVPGLDAALVPGAAVVLVPGRDSAGSPDGPESSGKTQLAAGLAGSLRQSRSVDLLAWVTATSRASVLSGYVQAAARLGLDHGRDAEAVAARFLAWLDGAARPWLVVLDDLRDAADLDGLWPAGPAGRVLITAADAAAVPGEHGALVCPVPPFSIQIGRA